MFSDLSDLRVRDMFWCFVHKQLSLVDLDNLLRLMPVCSPNLCSNLYFLKTLPATRFCKIFFAGKGVFCLILLPFTFLSFCSPSKWPGWRD